MAAPRPENLSILVLTEDSGKHGYDTAAALCKKMLQLVEPSCQTHRVDFEPANERARRVMNGNLWKNKKNRRELVALRQTIATKLCEPNGFVIFHFDGDCAWSKRASAQTPKKFRELIHDHVRALLLQGVNRREPLTEDDADARMLRLRTMVPFYSIEAWLYQNTEVAIALCRKHYSGKHISKFEQWRTCRYELDEVDRPKEEVCLASKYNRELATRRYPARDVYAAGASFQAAVDSLRECIELADALQKTVPELVAAPLQEGEPELEPSSS